MIPPCPDCGSRFTFINAQARGPAQKSYNAHGRFFVTHHDNLYLELSKTVRCEECGKIRRDLALIDCQIRVVVREGEGEGKT